MPKLNQILAIEKSCKTRIEDEITQIHQAAKKPALLNGLAKTYQPKEEGGEAMPPDGHKVQARASEILSETARVLSELFDLTLTKDIANCFAKADVTIGEETILRDVPVTHLLFLNTRLQTLHLTISAMPTLDPGEDWTFDSGQNCMATKPVTTSRSKKIMRNHVKAEATKEHPAQVDVYTEDQPIGYWTTIKYSGAIDFKRKSEILARIERLQAAVAIAREAGNLIEAPEQREGKKIFEYLFGA